MEDNFHLLHFLLSVHSCNWIRVKTICKIPIRTSVSTSLTPVYCKQFVCLTTKLIQQRKKNKFKKLQRRRRGARLQLWPLIGHILPLHDFRRETSMMASSTWVSRPEGQGNQRHQSATQGVRRFSRCAMTPFWNSFECIKKGLYTFGMLPTWLICQNIETPCTSQDSPEALPTSAPSGRDLRPRNSSETLGH